MLQITVELFNLNHINMKLILRIIIIFLLSLLTIFTVVLVTMAINKSANLLTIGGAIFLCFFLSILWIRSLNLDHKYRKKKFIETGDMKYIQSVDLFDKDLVNYLKSPENYKELMSNIEKKKLANNRNNKINDLLN